LPGRVVVVDLAAEATGGATTALALSHPRVRRVVAADARHRNLARYLSDCDPTPRARLIETHGEPGPANLTDTAGASALVLTTAHAGAEAAAQARHWLGDVPEAVALVFGLGPTGDCAAVEALTAACVRGSGLRLTLARELAPALAGSQLGLVAARNHGAMAEALFRVRMLYTDHFKYLDLVRGACQAALEQAALEDASLRGTPQDPDGTFATGPLDEASMAGLRQALEAREREVQALRRSLAEATGSLGYKLVHRARQVLRVVAPEGSPQRWLLRKMAGAARILYTRGFRGVIAKLTRRAG
jgi:hypothetical protein